MYDNVSFEDQKKDTLHYLTQLYCLLISIKNGESWKVSNCSTATCTNGEVSVTPVSCPTVTEPICTNGRRAVKIYEEDGCCIHYECECK